MRPLENRATTSLVYAQSPIRIGGARLSHPDLSTGFLGNYTEQLRKRVRCGPEAKRLGHAVLNPY